MPGPTIILINKLLVTCKKSDQNIITPIFWMTAVTCKRPCWTCPSPTVHSSFLHSSFLICTMISISFIHHRASKSTSNQRYPQSKQTCISVPFPTPLTNHTSTTHQPHINHSQPLTTTHNHSQPLTTTHNHSQPLTTTHNHSSKPSTLPALRSVRDSTWPSRSRPTW